jgi:cephalosporin-C deacetylase-like acetyl esterase
MYLFLPKNGTPPYQTVINFPSTALFTQSDPNRMPVGSRYSKIYNKNGRAFLQPIYKGALERNDGKFSEWFMDMGSTKYKDMMIMWVKDVGRCIDYLETRSDIDTDKIAYTGVSLGAANGAIIPAIEKRIKTTVLTVAGLWHSNILPEVDQINYLPRITIPVLMINGKYDHIFPLESSQQPMFEFLGTPDNNKKLFINPNGHHVPNNIIIKETLNWLDKYLGPVEPGI